MKKGVDRRAGVWGTGGGGGGGRGNRRRGGKGNNSGREGGRERVPGSDTVFVRTLLLQYIVNVGRTELYHPVFVVVVLFCVHYLWKATPQDS